MIETSLAPLLPGVDDDFGVGMGPEGVAKPRQLRRQRLKIVDLTIEDDAHRAVLVELRLVAGHEIDDCEPAVPQAYPRHTMETFAVGSAMNEDIGHPAQQDAIDLAAPVEIENPGYAAHFLWTGRTE